MLIVMRICRDDRFSFFYEKVIFALTLVEFKNTDYLCMME